VLWGCEQMRRLQVTRAADPQAELAPL